MTMLKYKIISYLLSYPTKKYLQDIEMLKQEILELKLEKSFQEKVLSFIEYLSINDIYKLQTQYVSCFDGNPSLSLYLFDHIVGDSKERGEALVSLKEEYQKYNFDILTNELPDFLPLFLEFISQLPEAEVVRFLQPVTELFNDLCLRHRKVNSPYDILFEALVLAGGNKIKEKPVSVLTQDEIDAMWKEQEVTFATKACN